jgi:soluble lytic murein transglycosylase-like protein
MPRRRPLAGLVAAILVAALAGDPALATTASPELEVPPPGKLSAANKRSLKPMIDGIAKQRGVDADLVHAVIAAESGYNPRAVSPKGAIGLMQVMPATAADYGIASVDDLFDPKTNVDVGTRHLKRLLGKYGSIRQAVAAYNAGEGALERNNAAVAYPETRRYQVHVFNHYWRNKGKEPHKLRQLGLAPLVIQSTFRNLDPGLHKVGPNSKPMFVLEPKQ